MAIYVAFHIKLQARTKGEDAVKIWDVLLVLLTTLLSQLSLANTTSTKYHTADKTTMKINSGDYIISGNIYFGENSSGPYYSLNPEFQYFVRDGIALGTSLEFSSNGSGDLSKGIGPIVSIFFNARDNTVFSFTQSLRYSDFKTTYSNGTYSDTRLRSSTSIVFNYFANPSVALGLGLAHYRNVKDRAFPNTTIFTQIGVHL
jgi:hypothetical protein